MMTGFRNLLWLLPLSLLLSWPVWSGSFIRVLSPRGGLAASDAALRATAGNGAGFSMEGVLFSQLKNGARDWQIEANRLYTQEDQDKMELEAVEAQVFKGAERRFVIIGQEGEYNSKEKILTMRKGVTVQAENDFLVQSDSLTYDDQTRKITTRTPVQITSKGMNVRGQGLSYDMEQDSFDVSGRVRVDIR
jgi:LPS export ABC transporter protein LptC